MNIIKIAISISYWKTIERRNGDKFIQMKCEEIIQEYFNSLRKLWAALLQNKF